MAGLRGGWKAWGAGIHQGREQETRRNPLARRGPQNPRTGSLPSAWFGWVCGLPLSSCVPQRERVVGPGGYPTRRELARTRLCLRDLTQSGLRLQPRAELGSRGRGCIPWGGSVSAPDPGPRLPSVRPAGPERRGRRRQKEDVRRGTSGTRPGPAASALVESLELSIYGNGEGGKAIQ